ncbi:MoaD/ThiS family protein [Methylacidiphilum kamchatkense]|uniref:Molybdopterin synthase sulfur carrier subunit n=1 Tax=Methylacidiphilum kamchatkense Kam1 TaxID=1202785 RepID=A0A516TKC4_9BACT|nr:MoaD/ThiS family protein [Methylacidiphilum kamchatkense]QDQ41675.1 molybdopterin synthase sulfur carrier subunit [Methylacidiphilum kamchatkense Kam1]
MEKETRVAKEPIGTEAIRILAFAQAKELLGFTEKMLFVDRSKTPREIIIGIEPTFFEKIHGARVAIDQRYASWDQPIEEAEEMAIIPPVSGG